MELFTLGAMTSQLSCSTKKKDLGVPSRKKRKRDVDPLRSFDEMFLITPDEGQAAQSQEVHRKKAKKKKFSGEISPSDIDHSWVTTESNLNCEAEISTLPKKKKKKLYKQGTEDEIWSQSPPEKASQLCPNNNQVNGSCVDYTPSHKKKKKKLYKQGTEDEIWSQPPPEKASQLCPNNNQVNGSCVDYTPSHKKKKKKRYKLGTEDDIWSQPPSEKASQLCPNNNPVNESCVDDYTPSHKKKKKKKKREMDFGGPDKCTEAKSESPHSTNEDYTRDRTGTQLGLFPSDPPCTTGPQKEKKKKRKSQKSSQSLCAADSNLTEIDLEMESSMTSKRKREQCDSVPKSAFSESRSSRCSQSPVFAATDTTCPFDSKQPPSEEDEELLDSAAFSADFLEAAAKELEEYIPHVRSLTDSAIRQLAERDLARFRRFKKKGIAVKFGVFSKAENALLKRNMEAFLEISGIETAEKALFPHRFPEEHADIKRLKIRNLFCERISKDIPRPWRLIYYRARKLLDPQNYNGSYSKEEMKKLRKYYAIYGNNWKKISDLMNRSSHSISLKITQMIEVANCNFGPWAEDETQRLIQIIKGILRSKAQRLDPASNKGKTLVLQRENLYKNIGWMKVASEMKTRCWWQCKQRWTSILTKKMMGSKNFRNKMENLRFKIALIERLCTLNVEDTSEINWEHVSEVVGNVPPAYVQARFHLLKSMNVPFWYQKEFPEIIDYLFDVTLPELKAALEQVTKRSGRKKPIKLKKTFRFTDIFNDSDDDEFIHLRREND